MNFITKLASGVFVSALLLAGCSSPEQTTSPTPTEKPSQSESQTSQTTYPLTLDNCGESITFDKAPERIVMMAELNAPILYDLDLLDKVVARAGFKNMGPAGKELREAIDKIPSMATSESGSGHYRISTESVLELNADMVIAYFDGVDKEKLEEAGVKVYSPPSNCPEGRPGVATFDWVDEEIDNMANLFNVPQRSQELKNKVAQQLDNLGTDENKKGTAAALFVTPGSPEFWTYGAASMSHPIMEMNGLENAYGDIEKRVFQLSIEDLLDKDPDWLVIMTLESNAEEAREALKQINGTSELKAVREGKLLHLPYALTDPPSTLSVYGAVELAEGLKEIA